MMLMPLGLDSIVIGGLLIDRHRADFPEQFRKRVSAM